MGAQVIVLFILAYYATPGTVWGTQNTGYHPFPYSVPDPVEAQSMDAVSCIVFLLWAIRYL